MTNSRNWQQANPRQPLRGDTVHVWLYPLDLSPQTLDHFARLLSTEEIARSERLVHRHHRNRFIAAHGFLRSGLSSYTMQAANELSFVLGQHGKPALLQYPDLHFNLSHAHDMAMLAIGCKPVGIDIEYVDRKSNWQGIMHRFYTPSEIKKIMALPEHLRQQAFFQVWTRKEAYMKVTGMGLYLSPSQFTVSVPPEPAALLALDSGEDVAQWQMSDIALPVIAERYCACLSVTGPANRVETFIFA